MEILEAFQVLLNNGLDQSDLDTMIDSMLEADAMDEEDMKRVALYAYLISNGDSVSPEDIQEVSHDNDSFQVGGSVYRVLTDDDANEAYDEYLESLLNEAVPGSESPYFDRDQWKEDVKSENGRGQLASYDGEENFFSGCSEIFYIYQMD